jgi:DNA-directed RNA polymerase specialized sigma24 family protein
MREMEIREFLEIVRSGDQPAVERAIAWLAPWLTRAISRRLVDCRIRRIADTADIFQSLMKDFLARKRTDLGAAKVGLPAKSYLVAAIQKKILMRLRKEGRRIGSVDVEPLSRDGSPAPEVEGRDFVDAIRNRLREEDHWPFDQRLDGFTWREISLPMGVASDTLRMRLRRSVATAIYDLNREESKRVG